MENLISIIIPTFNRSSLIGVTLDSVIAQTYTNWECIVVDDGSSDGTTEIVEFYSSNDERINLYPRPEEKPKGASSCRNYGLEISNGEYIQFLDSDDLISKEKLSSQLKLLEKKPQNSIATCKWGTFKDDLDNSKIHQNLKAYDDFENPSDFINAMGVSICYFPPHAYLIRKSIIIKAGYWNEYLSLNDDSEFMIRVIINSDKICFSEDSIAFYRLPGEDNLSYFNSESKVLDAIYSWMLIENYLKIRFKKEEFPFIERAKNDFYQHAKVFPELLIKNKEYFKSQIRRETSWIKKIFLSN
ncbi:glycosyltransferase family 2 protein [Gillisia sp. JM1]|uniref:glycosyltransferase family 2 protein n=1 Tax=Gillisia sp. JM1 TaxID=1283286 RepID=UPI000425FDFF|nr:glycosyltransferase family A protein [Gillisia sp. JM1]